MAVLIALEDEEAHGYVLLQRVRADGHAAVTGSTLYPLLARFEEKGWIHHRWEHGTSGPGRKVFSVTGAGHHQVDVLLDEWARVRATVDGISRNRKWTRQ